MATTTTTVIKYIGRTTDFRGQTLWEIVASQRDMGVGRMVIRNMFQRYTEPCYMRILKVEPVESVPNEETRKVRVTVQKTWRGVTLPKPITIYSASYKADYELVPRNEEHKYLQNENKLEERILQNKVELPPLLREFVRQETGVQEPMMKVHFKKKDNKFVRLAQDGEQPTISLSMSLGKPEPVAEKLYEGIL